MKFNTILDILKKIWVKIILVFLLIFGLQHLDNMELNYFKQVRKLTLYRNISYAVMIIPLFEFEFGFGFGFGFWEIANIVIWFLISRVLH